MTADEQISALLQEAAGLNCGPDSVRLRDLYTRAIALVDRAASPKKWAGFRFLYGQASEAVDMSAALTAYRDAVGCFDPVHDHDGWAACQDRIGSALIALGRFSPPASEEVIACFESAIKDYPHNAAMLALFYEVRVTGDPWQNWHKQVQYLELALAQVSPRDQAVEWARLKSAIAAALPREPDGDFRAALERSIEYQREALNILEAAPDRASPAAQDRWIMICVDTSDAYLSRVGTDAADDAATAESYARRAYAACGPLTGIDTRTFATMALARALLSGSTGTPAPASGDAHDRAREGLRLCLEAGALIDVKAKPVIAATNEKFKLLAHLRLLDPAKPVDLDPLLAAADAAYGLLDPKLYPDLCCTVMQLATDGLFQCGDFQRAIDYLRRSISAGEYRLEQATSRAGRLERIFNLHDDYARLGYCRLHGADVPRGVEALDAGKGRLWRAMKRFASFDEIRGLAPAGGALLFATFAPADGAVAVVSERGERVVHLRGAGRRWLASELFGDLLDPESASWVSRYSYRHADPQRWHDAIDSIGRRLHEVVWAPVIECLQDMGISAGAELVWFPQAGSGVLPLHAAWTDTSAGGRRWLLDDYAIRYAPSATCLIGKAADGPRGPSLIVANPSGDLQNSALEVAWVCAADHASDEGSEQARQTTLLARDAAIKSRVCTELQRARHAHFATHAVFRVSDPFKSGLLMANGELLTLDELLPLLEKSPVREVVLSGCETAMTQIARRPDELLGFPAAFLEHGAATVIATQWPIDDWAAGALIGRFYREWRRAPPPSTAQAMRTAQIWLRDVTVRELSDLLQPLKSAAGDVGELAAETRSVLNGLDPVTRPFAHPYYWAPFTVTGL